MKSLKLWIVLFLTIASSGCANFEIADIAPGVQLPASKDCYQISVVSRKKTRTKPAECEKIRQRSLFITSEDWKKQRISIQKNCQLNQCKQLIGAFDELFLTIDKALQKIP